jgi:hypothetical protein
MRLMPLLCSGRAQGELGLKDDICACLEYCLLNAGKSKQTLEDQTLMSKESASDLLLLSYYPVRSWT